VTAPSWLWVLLGLALVGLAGALWAKTSADDAEARAEGARAPLPPDLPREPADLARVGTWRSVQTPLGPRLAHVELSGDGTWGAKVYPGGASRKLYSGSSGAATADEAVALAVAGLAALLSDPPAIPGELPKE